MLRYAHHIEISGEDIFMSIKNYIPTIADRQLASLAANWENTARQQTVYLRDGERVIVTEDKQGRIGVIRVDRYGTAIKRAEL
jgi:hypothetical protein